VDHRQALDQSVCILSSKIIILYLNFHRHTQVETGIDESLSELGLDYVDLWLIHWPHDNEDYKKTFDHVETWKKMQKLIRPGNSKTRHIGISNFSPQQVDDLMKLEGIKPQFHEFELHPYLQQSGWVEENLKRNITIIGYAPLGNTQTKASMGVSVDRNAVPPILESDLITGIAKARGCTPAQVVLAWNLKRNIVVIPKASQELHQKENIATWNTCKLTDEDVGKFKSIKQSIRFYPNACDYGLIEGCEMAKANPFKKSSRI
jgi:alcohol dehydrogenase (NADP+)